MKHRATRRSFLTSVSAISLGAASIGPTWRNATAGESRARRATAENVFKMREAGKKIPIIFDTDIGGDIDDTWALAMVLKSPELDVKLVTSDSGNDTYRARIIGKLLEIAGRADVPIGIGNKPGDRKGRQSGWVGDYQLKKYPGQVHEDGVGAIIETIRASREPITVVAVGPAPTIGEVVRRAPDVARKARFVGMHGSVRRGYGNSKKISAEYNVRAAPAALQDVFAADWEVSITPLDTCGIVHLTGDKYQQVYRCQDPLVKALIANYRVWCAADKRSPDPTKRSSTLFDTVAVYMAFSEELLEMEDVPLRVDDQGYTRIDPEARKVRCAMKWKSLSDFEDELVRRLTS